MQPIRRHADPAVQAEFNDLCRWLADARAKMNAAELLLAALAAAVAELKETMTVGVGETPPVDPPERKYWLACGADPVLYVYANGSWVQVGPEV